MENPQNCPKPPTPAAKAPEKGTSRRREALVPRKRNDGPMVEKEDLVAWMSWGRVREVD